MARWHPLLLVALAACGKNGGDDPVDPDGTPDDGETDTDTDADSDTDLPCEASVVAVDPPDAALDVALDAEVTATFDVAITDADPHTLDVSPATGTTTLASDGLSMTWVGTLEAETAYTVTASVCDETSTTGFTTVPPPLDLTGQVFALDLGGATWTEPVGVGPLLAGFLGDTRLWMSPTVMSETELTMLAGAGVYVDQDLCSPTLEFPTTSWTVPDFVLGEADLVLTVADIPLVIDVTELSGTFALSGSRIGDGVLEGSMDTRSLVDLVDTNGEDDAVCLLVESLGVLCAECPDGTGPFCLSVLIEDIDGPNVQGATLEVRTEADILGDPVCTP